MSDKLYSSFRYGHKLRVEKKKLSSKRAVYSCRCCDLTFRDFDALVVHEKEVHNL